MIIPDDFSGTLYLLHAVFGFFFIPGVVPQQILMAFFQPLLLKDLVIRRHINFNYCLRVGFLLQTLCRRVRDSASHDSYTRLLILHFSHRNSSFGKDPRFFFSVAESISGMPWAAKARTIYDKGGATFLKRVRGTLKELLLILFPSPTRDRGLRVPSVAEHKGTRKP